MHKPTLYTGKRAGDAAYELDTFDGRITWLNRANGKTYSDAIRSAIHIKYPEGVELFKPARVTVTGLHGGTFPIGGGQAGLGVLVYSRTRTISPRARPSDAASSRMSWSTRWCERISASRGRPTSTQRCVVWLRFAQAQRRRDMPGVVLRFCFAMRASPMALS